MALQKMALLIKYFLIQINVFAGQFLHTQQKKLFNHRNIHCPKSNPNFRDKTWNVVENMVLHEIFRVVSRFPCYISCYIAENQCPLRHCIMYMLDLSTSSGCISGESRTQTVGIYRPIPDNHPPSHLVVINRP